MNEAMPTLRGKMSWRSLFPLTINSGGHGLIDLQENGRTRSIYQLWTDPLDLQVFNDLPFHGTEVGDPLFGGRRG